MIGGFPLFLVENADTPNGKSASIRSCIGRVLSDLSPVKTVYPSASDATLVKIRSVVPEFLMSRTFSGVLGLPLIPVISL